ncbi:MAG TPA: hypothetical protein VNZ64_24785 [Candidatus Acidoferrum sp.]|jgi:hypothetical protein|nr:hypothetical protein [Candidatus Acidoferrum sp.]
MRAVNSALLATTQAVVIIGIFPLEAQVSVLTSHNDNARTGLNSNEFVLTQTNVNQAGFGKVFSQQVDGPVYAQPLYVPNLAIAGKGLHNVAFVATEHDSLYAFDADSDVGSNAAPLWHASFINPAAGITPVPAAEAAYPSPDCLTFLGEIGITGTPVIDAASGTLYVVSRTKEPVSPGSQTLIQVQRLHALDISAGSERANSPVTIAGVVSGAGAGNISGSISFDPSRELQRSALLLVGGVVYVSWASYCDVPPFHGWMIGYDATTLQPVGVFNDTPNGADGGIWMAGAGPAAADDGSIYCVTGNGTFDTSPNPQDFGDSFLKLTNGAALSVADYFTPFNEANLAAIDEDLGSGGALVLPNSLGSLAHPHLLVGGGKQGVLYLLDRDNLGHFNPVADSQIVQEVNVSGAVFGLPALFNQRLYVQAIGQPLKAFAWSSGRLNATPVSQTTESVGFRGATPSISANGVGNGVVWEVVPAPGYWVATLRAFNAADLSQKLYDSYLSAQAGAPDQLSYVKFVVPTVANGKVYVGTSNSLAVFGLRSLIWSITRDPAAGAVRLVFSGPAGMRNVVQVTTDLLRWADLGPGTPASGGTATYTDLVALQDQTRFYRVRYQ